MLPFIALILPSVLLGQEIRSVRSTGTLSVTSVPAGADIFIDSLYAGKTPLVGYELEEGEHVLKVMAPSAFAWNARAKIETVAVAAGRSLQKVFELGTVLTVNSIPAGGTILYQGAALGTTPMYLRSPELLTGELLIEKEGFVPERVSLTPDEAHPIFVRLKPAPHMPSDRYADLLGPDYGLGASNHWLTYASASGMIASGVLSAYLKHRANDNFEQYIRTRDPQRLANTRRLDRAAAASLIVTQVSFMVLAYLLLSD